MSSTFRGPTMEEFGTVMLSSHQDAFPQLALLLAIGFVIPVTNAGCERGLSCQDRIVTKPHNRLLEEKIDSLMRISLEGEIFDFN